MTGVPQAIIDATAITEMRTGAVTAIGAEVLAPRNARVLGHIGARGTAYWNVRLLCTVLPGLEEIRVHSRRPESREAFAARLRSDLGRILAGLAPGRESDAETIVFWHRGLSTTDIALGRALLHAASERGLGTRLPYR